MRPLFALSLGLATFGSALAQEALPSAAVGVKPPLAFTGPERATPTADGNLRPVIGVHNIQVSRANRTAPENADKLTDTYQHAPMLAYWHGKFYLEYLSAPVNEHDDPTVTSLTTSTDGLAWTQPHVIFPSFALPDGSHTITHQRMGFYTAPDGRLLVLAFYGKHPAPNDGTGLGRAVREIRADGTLGPIYFIRFNAKQPYPNFTPPYALYATSPDKGFVAACDALLADKLMTAQWWEEDQLDTSGFYRISGKALSFVHRPDNSVLGIWKNRVVATTKNNGDTWENKSLATNMPNNASKYWLQHTADNRYALVFNPTNRNRYPLAVATSTDAENFSNLWTVFGELPDQRYGGGFKNLGPQYVRGIEETNGMPPDADRAMWLTHSVNKEDIWITRVPTPITATAAPGPISEDFESTAVGTLPANWNIYSPLWAPVRVVETNSAGKHALELRDEDPYDYARAIRVFPATHNVKISFKIFAAQTNGRLEIDLLDAAGARPVRLALEEDGTFWACHEGQWFKAAAYTANAWHTFTLEIPRNGDNCALTFDGKTVLTRAAIFTDPVDTVERLSFRTGVYRERGYGGRDLPSADKKVLLARFLIDDVTISPAK